MTTQSQIPLAWYLPFAQNDPNRVEIPVTQGTPGNGRASQSTGFPPETMEPPESGGVPPNGEDFNGAMNQVARVAWWLLNGGLFPYNSTFATNSNINGYPNGAVLLRADLQGLWINQVDNNQVNPDSATGTTSSNNWAPLMAYGRLNLTTLTGGTTTLTYSQAAFDRLVLSGTLASNQVINVPNWIKRWTIVNNTTGAFSLTLTPAGGGSSVIVPQNGNETPVVCDGTNLSIPGQNVAAATTANQPAQMGQIQNQSGTAFAAGGAAPNYTLTTVPTLTAYAANQRFRVAFAANGTLGSNTLNIDGLGAIGLRQYDGAGNLVPATIVSGMLTDVEYNGTYMVVLDPLPQSGAVVGAVRNFQMVISAASASGTATAEELWVKTGLGGGAYLLSNFSQTINLATTGAGGMDTGAAPNNGYVAVYAIYNPSANTRALLATVSTNAIAPDVYGGANMPSGYTASALVSVWRTTAATPGLFIVGRQVDRLIVFPFYVALNAVAPTTTFTQLVVNGGVPPNGKTCQGVIAMVASSTAGGSAQVASDSSGSGAQAVAIGGTGVGANASFANVPVQINGSNFPTLFYAAPGGGVTNMSINISGYTF
jgi:hypothetical protein